MERSDNFIFKLHSSITYITHRDLLHMCKHVSDDSQIHCIACGTSMCKTSRIRKLLLTHVTSIWFVTRVSVCVWLDLWL